MQCVVSILSTFVFLGTSCTPADAADSQPTGTGLCANYRCGPPEGAICEETGSTYKCICNDGWQYATSGVCIPNGPCGRYPCGPHSDRCLWTGGNDYTCVCKTGFGLNKLTQPTCVQVVEECANNPCGVRGVCTSTADGGHTCECASGYKPAPSPAGTTCKSVQKVGCKSESCGPEYIGKCVETASGYFCICRENSKPYFNHDAEASCQATADYDFCHTNACGENGTSCTSVEGYRACTCGDGYEPKAVNLWGDQRCYLKDLLPPTTPQQGGQQPEQPEQGGQQPEQGGQQPEQGGQQPEQGGQQAEQGGQQPEEGEQQQQEDEQKPQEGFKITTNMLIVGGLVVLLLIIVIAAVMAVIRCFKKSKGGEAVDRQHSVDFEGREGIPADSQEADVLIKARNEDWAH